MEERDFGFSENTTLPIVNVPRTSCYLGLRS
jgi:hypothetical protein